MSASKLKSWLAATTVLASVAAGPALAQSPPTPQSMLPPAAPATPAAVPQAPVLPAQPPSEVSEITVTARHRQESLQSVPISIAVVNGAAMAAKNLNDIGDISTQVPSVDFRTGASNKDRTIFVRGVGTISTSPGVEPSVSTVVDGVVLARPGQATVDLLDLDHIEVLRGPQGTLFGKNASAGVINIVTKNPTAVPAGVLQASYFQGDEYRVAGAVSGPIVDGIDGLLSAFTSGYDGNVRDVYHNEQVNGYEHTGGRMKIIAHPSSSFTVTFTGDYTHEVDTVPTGVFTSASQVAYPTGAVSTNTALAGALSSVGITPNADNRTVSDNVHSTVHDNNGGAALQLDWDFAGGYRLTSITAWRGWQNHQYQDYDQLSTLNASLPQVQDTGRLLFHQTSEELRIASPKGHLIDYVVGLYFLDDADHETYERDVQRIIGGAPKFDFGVNHYGSADDNYAIFGEANLNLTSRFRLIGGVRGVRDDLSFYNNRVSTATATNAVTGVQPSYATTGSVERDGVAGRAGAQYDFTREIMGYITYSHGYKGPAYNVFFNMNPVNTGVLNPETSNSYEAGFKSQLFHRRVQLDVAGFITNFDNFQANSVQVVSGALVTNLVNAGSVTSRGVEVDLTAKPLQGLTFDFDGTYDDAHVVNFPCPPGAAASCNINGQPLPFAPKWKLHVEADYRVPLTERWDLDLDSNYNFQSKTQYQLNEFPDTVQPAYGIWNASIGLLDGRSGWTMRFLVKNILNQDYSSYLAHGNLAGLVRWVPRDDHRYVGVFFEKQF